MNMNTGIIGNTGIIAQKPEIKPEAKSASASKSDAAKHVRCDACGCAFTPEFITQRDGDIDYTFFRCAYCGKAYMVSITDEKLRQDIARYMAITKKGRLTAEETREAIELLRANKERVNLLRHQHLKEESHE